MNIPQLEENLESLPQQIRDQAIKEIEAEKKLDEAKLEYDVAFGMILVGSKKPNATLAKAEATIATKSESQKLLEAKYNHKKEEASFNYLDNKFIATRKIASLESDLIKSNISGY